MSSRTWIIAGCLTAVATAYCTAVLFADEVAAEEVAAEKPADQQSLPSFKDRIVLLVIDDSSALENKRGSAYLKEPVLRKIGDRYFILGDAYTLPESSEGSSRPWQTGAHVGIAWEKVQAFYVYTPQRLEELWKERSSAE